MRATRTLVASVLLIAGQPLAAAPGFVVVAKTGDPIPGVTGATYSLMGAPSISRGGSICVWGHTSLESDQFAEVAVSHPTNAAASSVVEGAPVSGSDRPWIVNQYHYAPTINNAGSVLWHATLTQTDGGPPYTGVSIASSHDQHDQLRAIFGGNVPVVGLEPGWTFRRSGPTSVKFGETGTATARGILYAPDGQSAASIIAAEDPLGSRLLLNANDQAPGLPPGTPYTAFTLHVMNSVGDIGVASRSGVWFLKRNGVVPVCLRDSIVSLDGVDARVTGGFELLSMNDSGEMVMPVDVYDFGRVILAGTAGDLREVARISEFGPFRHLFEGPVIGASGAVAFVLSAVAKDTYGPAVAYFVDRTARVPLAGSGDPAPGFPEGSTFGDGFERIEINARDQVVFSAIVNLGSQTAARAIYAWTRGAGLLLLARDRSELRLIDGTEVRVEALIHLGNSFEQSPSAGGEDGRTRMLADNAQVVFAVMSTNLNYYTLSTTLPGVGDINADGLITGADLSVLLSQFGHAVKPGDSGDFNLDGLVTGSDLSVLLSALASQN